jgi:hypothetical protein
MLHDHWLPVFSITMYTVKRPDAWQYWLMRNQ